MPSSSAQAEGLYCRCQLNRSLWLNPEHVYSRQAQCSTSPRSCLSPVTSTSLKQRGRSDPIRARWGKTKSVRMSRRRCTPRYAAAAEVGEMERASVQQTRSKTGSLYQHTSSLPVEIRQFRSGEKRTTPGFAFPRHRKPTALSGSFASSSRGRGRLYQLVRLLP